MMDVIDPQEVYAEILNECSKPLRHCGFTRKGVNFRKVVDGNVQVVNFQKSSSSSRDEVKFTMNLGIVVGRLNDHLDAEGATVGAAHLAERIGMLLDGSDKWWFINSATARDALTVEVVDATERVAIPYLAGLETTQAIAKLWRSGVSPGVTQKLRARYLAEITQE
jgi:hypothetical protein